MGVGCIHMPSCCARAGSPGALHKRRSTQASLGTEASVPMRRVPCGLGCTRFWMLKPAILEAYASDLRWAALGAGCIRTRSHKPPWVLKQAFLEASSLKSRMQAVLDAEAPHPGSLHKRLSMGGPVGARCIRMRSFCVRARMRKRPRNLTRVARGPTCSREPP